MMNRMLGVQLKRLRSLTQFLQWNEMKRAYQLLWPFVFKHWKSYVVLVFLMLVDIVMTILFARFFGQMIDAATSQHFSRLKALIPVGILLIVLSIVSNFASLYFETKTLQGVKRDLKNAFFRHILRLPVGKASEQHSGELISHFTTDIHSIDGIIGTGMLNLMRLPLIFITVFIYLISINWQLSLINILLAPAALFFGAIFGVMLRRNGHEIFTLNGRINTLLSETFQGWMVIRSFTLEKLTFKNYQKKNEELYDLELESAKLQGWFYSGGRMVSSLSFILTLCLGAYFILKGDMTVGALVTFINLVNHIVYPVQGIASQWATFQRALSAWGRVVKVWEIPVDTKWLPDYRKPELVGKGIIFKNLTFSYDEWTQVFNGFNLEIEAGKTIAFVGPSGSGKTSLFNLLQGFYRPQRGAVYIDGRSVDEMSRAELRNMIAIVPQETFLFAGTIRDNLMLAREKVTEEEMIAAATEAHIHDFIMSLPDGYDTEIGERGVRLSGGQKQRIAIARAFLKNAPILLLDEATSSLDNETEEYVKAALAGLMKGRTTLMIAHKLSTIQAVDEIVVIYNGELIQRGTHEELLRDMGLYARLHEKSGFSDTRDRDDAETEQHALTTALR